MELNIKENNLDWLRLLFACQVMISHSGELGSEYEFPSVISETIGYFPGVPAFFFLSGFLIWASYDRSPNVKTFFLNRFYRLWPGLVFVTIAGLSVAIFGNLLTGSSSEIDTVAYVSWFFAQVTIGQTWNPSISLIGDRWIVNGALWTITVEILFYISVPILFWVSKKYKYFIYAALIASFFVFVGGESLLEASFLAEKNLFKYFNLTPLVWGWMFLIGVITYQHKNSVGKYFKLTLIGFPMMLVCIILDSSVLILFQSSGNRLGVVYFISYCAVIMFLGFGTKVMKIKFDFSYGIYIWHMVVINFFFIIGWNSMSLFILTTISLACFSWFVIEKPALKLKSFSIKN